MNTDTEGLAAAATAAQAMQGRPTGFQPISHAVDDSIPGFDSLDGPEVALCGECEVCFGTGGIASASRCPECQQ
jgi:hypothetical protein